MNKKRLTKFVISLFLSLLLISYNPMTTQSLSLAHGENNISVQGEQLGINYQVFTGNSEDHYVVRFFKEGSNPSNARITELQVNLEIENGTLLSVAPAGQIDGNKSNYKFSSRRGLNNQLGDKGLFLIFKYDASDDSKGMLSFSVTEYTQLSRTSVSKDSDVITFSLR